MSVESDHTATRPFTGKEPIDRQETGGSLRATATRPQGRLLSLREAERESGIPRGSLRKLIDERNLPAVELPGIRRVLIDRTDLHELIDNSKTA